MGKVIGLILFIWGIAIIPLAYHTAVNDPESTPLAVGVAGVICIVFLILGLFLMVRKGASKKVTHNYYIQQARPRVQYPPRRRRGR